MMKKFFAILLAAALVLSLATAAFAVSATNEIGTLTVNGTSDSVAVTFTADGAAIGNNLYLTCYQDGRLVAVKYVANVTEADWQYDGKCDAVKAMVLDGDLVPVGGFLYSEGVLKPITGGDELPVV